MRTYRMQIAPTESKPGLPPFYVALLALVSVCLLGFAVASLAGGQDSAPALICPAVGDAKPANGSSGDTLAPAPDAQQVRSRGVWV
jgi:hypothetical protein